MNGEAKIADRKSISALLTQAEFRALLGGMSERKFHQLRASGVVGPPLDLGPRVARWTQDDYLETLSKLPRRLKQAEPQCLVAGRSGVAGKKKGGDK